MSSSRKRKFSYNNIYKSQNSGEFKIIEYIGGPTELVKIKFLLTDTEEIITINAALTGRVKDKFYPRICGVGYIGNFDGCISKGWPYVMYRTWYKMINRCYNPNEYSYQFYGSIGVSVDPSWFSFATFYHDVKLLPNYDKKLKYSDKFQLDKDYLQQNIPKEKRIYSKNTCIWISRYDNDAMKLLDKQKDGYIGVDYNDNGTFRARSMYNSNIGTFTNEIAAANAYNYFYNLLFYRDQFRNIKPLNNVPYMSPTEFIKYNTNVEQPIREIVIKQIK